MSGESRQRRAAPQHPLSPTAPPRPLLFLALALVLAGELGLRAPLHGNPLACALAGALLVGLRPRWCRRSSWVAASLLCAVVLFRAAGLAIPVVAQDASVARAAESVPESSASDFRVGRYHGDVAGLGWLEHPDGRPPDRLLELEDTAAEDGDWIAVSNRSEVVAWPRGAEPGTLAARFPRGIAVLRADELVRLGATEPADGFRALGPEDGRSASASERLIALRSELARSSLRAFPRETAGVARALLFGDRSELSSETADLFTRTGTRHLLAVSGLHVALVAALCLLPLSRFVERQLAHRGRRTLGRVLGCASFILLLLAFAGLAGYGAPVVRAAFALSLAALARLLPARRSGRARAARGRQPDALSLWALVLVVEVLLDPRATRSLSIQLSYLATLGILIGTRPIADTLQRLVLRALGQSPTRRQLRLLHSSGGWWRAPLTRVGRSVCFGIAASSAAVLATLPIAWPTFGECAPLGVLATALVLPLFVFVMGALWASVGAGLLGWTGPLRELASDAILWLLRVLEQVDALPGTPLPLPARPAGLVALASVCALLAAATHAPRWKRAAALAFGALLLPWSAAPASLEVELLDVGHGCALMLRAPGEPCVLFDSGSRDRRHLYHEALAPQLARWDVATPVIALSHDDRDHAAGFAHLIERFPPRAWLGEQPRELVERLPAECVRLDLARGALDYRSAKSALRLSLLRGSDEEGNEGSRTLAVEFEERRLLLFGDSEDEGLGALLRAGALGPVDLLLFPHHGSDCRWLAELLEQTRPKEIWISAGAEPAVAGELTRRGLRWSSTSRAGPLSSSSARFSVTEAAR